MNEYWKILQRQEAGRLLTRITPYKRSAVRGREIRTLPRTPYGVQPTSGLAVVDGSSTPALRYACTGLSIFKAFRPFTFPTFSITYRLKMEVLIN
jgi:hypothetical protein